MPGEFRPITELCQFQMADEERQLCNQAVEEWTDKVKAYCFSTQQTNPADFFCMTALPPPSPQVRTQNILGDRAHMGRLLVIPQLPVDFDDLPDILQDAFDEDAYEAVMEDEPLPSPGEVASGQWFIELFAGLDLGGFSDTLNVAGGESPPPGRDQATRFAARFGGGLDAGYQFDVSEHFDIQLSAGGEYICDYSSSGGNLNTFYGRLRLGFVIQTAPSFDLVISALTKLGYSMTDDPVYDPSTGNLDLEYFDAGAGVALDWIWHGEALRAGFGLEALYNITRAQVGDVSVGTFPIPFIAHILLGWNS